MKHGHKSWPTWKIKEVLADPYTRGINGRDYEDVREELQDELWSRESKQIEKYIQDELNKIDFVPF